MGWTAPKTWSDGEVPDAADFNAQIRDNERYLKGQDGVPLIEDALELKDMDGTPVGNIRLKVVDEILQLRNAADSADEKMHFNSCPAGTGATELAIGNHTHALSQDTTGSQGTSQGCTQSGTYYHYAIFSGVGEVELASKTLTYDSNSRAAGVAYLHGQSSYASNVTVRLYMGGVQVAESAPAPATTTTNLMAVGTKILSGSQDVKCKANLSSAPGQFYILSYESGGVGGAGVGAGSVKW